MAGHITFGSPDAFLDERSGANDERVCRTKPVVLLQLLPHAVDVAEEGVRLTQFVVQRQGFRENRRHPLEIAPAWDQMRPGSESGRRDDGLAPSAQLPRT